MALFPCNIGSSGGTITGITQVAGTYQDNTTSLSTSASCQKGKSYIVLGWNGYFSYSASVSHNGGTKLDTVSTQNVDCMAMNVYTCNTDATITFTLTSSAPGYRHYLYVYEVS